MKDKIIEKLKELIMHYEILFPKLKSYEYELLVSIRKEIQALEQESNQGTELPPVESKDTDEIIEVLKKYERQIDDSDYHDVAIFDCDYKAIADELLEQQPAKELFEKVYIRSEEDLPKEDGMYFINIKGKGIGINVCRFEVKLDIQNWMSNIDWYLRPLE